MRVLLFLKADVTTKVYGGKFSKLVTEIPQDYEEKKRMEAALWSETVKEIPTKVSKNIVLTIPAGFENFFMDLSTDVPLSKEDIEGLSKTSSIYFITILFDVHGNKLLESCVHTEPRTQAMLFCVEHN